MRSQILTLVITILSVLSCGEKSTAPRSNTDYFPHGVGSVWIYAVYDSLSGQSYDLTVTVADTATIMGMPVTLWTHAANGDVDTQYVYVSNDTVRVYSHEGTTLEKIYVFPLDIGDSWNYGGSLWQYTVDSRGRIHVPAGSFSNAFHIDGDYFMPNDYGKSSEWFVRGIGPVRYDRYFICTVGLPMIYVNEIGKLKSYQLNR